MSMRSGWQAWFDFGELQEADSAEPRPLFHSLDIHCDVVGTALVAVVVSPPALLDSLDPKESTIARDTSARCASMITLVSTKTMSPSAPSVPSSHVERHAETRG